MDVGPALPLAVEPDPPPVAFLSAAEPNPFHDRTSFRMSVVRAGAVRVRIRDLQGRVVRTLADARLESGNYRWGWDGRTAYGETTAPGVYFIEVSTPCATTSRPVIRLK